jgi:hypothetical protein
MTLHTYDKIVCQCGHEGGILCEHADEQEISDSGRYRVIGFDGGSVTHPRSADQETALIEALRPCCPRCRRVGAVSFACAW